MWFWCSVTFKFLEGSDCVLHLSIEVTLLWCLHFLVLFTIHKMRGSHLLQTPGAPVVRHEARGCFHAKCWSRGSFVLASFWYQLSVTESSEAFQNEKGNSIFSSSFPQEGGWVDNYWAWSHHGSFHSPPKKIGSGYVNRWPCVQLGVDGVKDSFRCMSWHLFQLWLCKYRNHLSSCK